MRLRVFLVILTLWLKEIYSTADVFKIDTLAGIGRKFNGIGSSATSVLLYRQSGLWKDLAGNILVGDRETYQRCVIMVSYASGISHSTNIIPSMENPISFTGPMNGGDTFYALSASSTPYILKTSYIGITVTETYAGGRSQGYAGDGGRATSAQLNIAPYGLSGLWFNSIGVGVGALYVSDTLNKRIRVVNATNIINTFAGTGLDGDIFDGMTATSAGIRKPLGIWGDQDNNVYIADETACLIHGINNDGRIWTFAGIKESGSTGNNGAATAAKLMPQSMTGFGSGDNMKLYVLDNGISSRSTIRVIKRGSGQTVFIISHYAVSPSIGYDGDGGPATSASFGTLIEAIHVDSTNNLYISDPYNYVIRMVNATTGIVSTVIGSNSINFAGDNGLAKLARISTPAGVWYGNESLFFSDKDNLRIRQVDSSGLINTIAGTGFTGGANVVESSATSASVTMYVNSLTGLGSNVYFNDNNIVRKIDTTHATISTFAGSGTVTSSGFSSTSTMLMTSAGIFAYGDNCMLIAESGGHRIRKVNNNGIMVAVAGNGNGTFAGDGLKATSAKFKNPQGIWQDASKNVFVADTGNYRIRKIDNSTQIVTTIAGRGVMGTGINTGAATGVVLGMTYSLWGDTVGRLFYTLFTESYVKMISNGIVTNIAGYGTSGTVMSDGMSATQANLASPSYITGSLDGKLYVSEKEMRRIRVLSEYDNPTSQPSGQPSSQPRGKPTVQPSGQPIAQPTYQPTGQPSRQPAVKPTNRPSRQPTNQPSRQPSSQPSVQPSVQPLCCPSNQPSRQPSGQPSMQPSVQSSRRPSVQPSTHPSCSPTRQPLVQPLVQPSRQPSSQPSVQPMCVPSNQPTRQPSGQPSMQPSVQPSRRPSVQPSVQPSCSPTRQPSSQPSRQPVVAPTSCPSKQPSVQPSVQPICVPSNQPTRQPSGQPSMQPSVQPSRRPSVQPSVQPSCSPTRQPSLQPSRQPVVVPTSCPSRQPSVLPSGKPSCQPNSQPSSQPSSQPASGPSGQPSRQPNVNPTRQPSTQPTFRPASYPSRQPSEQPSVQPLSRPSAKPSIQPSRQPVGFPSTQPSSQPSSSPSSSPVGDPTGQPSDQPTLSPSTQPWSKPSYQPSTQPSSSPSHQPAASPTSQPVGFPSVVPSVSPSVIPSIQPSSKPTLQSIGCPSAHPSSRPSCQPSSTPSVRPSVSPSRTPSGVPSTGPSTQPISEPTGTPSGNPTLSPSAQPSQCPTVSPSKSPSVVPTNQPLSCPSSLPSSGPSSRPSGIPSKCPSAYPTTQPTSRPSVAPSLQPSGSPSMSPTTAPSSLPSCRPSLLPSSAPSGQPNAVPTVLPSLQPSRSPSTSPTSVPSKGPTSAPSSHPSSRPSLTPSAAPSGRPIAFPTVFPSSRPSCEPSQCPSVLPSAQPSIVPSSLPTVCPSVLPTVEPSSHPSARPSVVPSALPSVVPSMVPSALPSQQPFAEPTAFNTNPTYSPTAGPTESLLTRWKSAAQTLLDFVVGQQADSAQVLTHMDLNVKGNSKQVYGGCPAWTSLLSNTIPVTSMNYRVSSIQLNALHSLDTRTESQLARCTNKTAVEVIVNSLRHPSVSGIIVDCMRSFWTIKSCEVGRAPSMCVDCRDPCITSTTCTYATLFGLNPCSTQVCPGRNSSLQLLTLGLEDIQQAPDILSTIASSTKTSITVKMQLSASGSVYCALYPVLSDGTFTVPSSHSQIKLHNKVSSTSSTNHTQIVHNSLIAVTTYRVYCVAVSTLGTMTPLSLVLNSVQNVTTMCCRVATVTSAIAPVREGQIFVNYVTVKLSASPRHSLSMSLELRLNGTSNVVSNVFVPERLTVTSTELVYHISLAALSAGVYEYFVHISGEGASDYEIDYASSSSLSNKQLITVIGANVIPAAPHLSSAMFSNDGSYAVITFNTNTNRGNTSTFFNCGKLFSFTCADTSECQWVDSSTVHAFVTRSMQCASVGDIVSVLSSASITAACTASSDVCSSYPRIDNSGLTLSAPLSPIAPMVAISAPTVIGSCDTFTLDISGSNGSGGREWLTRNITVQSTASHHTLSEIQKFFDEEYQVSPPTAFNYTKIEKGHAYVFTVTLCNFLRQCSQATHKMTALNDVIPSVTLPGQSLRYVTRKATLSITSYVNLASCDGNSSVDMSYQWSVTLNGVPQLHLTSTSRDVTKMLLPAYSLAVNTLYTMTLTATLSETLRSSPASVQVFVQPGSVIDVVAGGLSRSVRVGDKLVLDASSSYDEDLNGVTGLSAGLTYSWTCLQTAPLLNNNCESIFDMSSNSSEKLSVTARSEAANAIGQITLTVSKGLRRSSVVVSVKILPSLSATVSVSSNAVNGVINSDKTLQLVGIVSLPAQSQCNAVWRSEDTALSLITKSPLATALTSSASVSHTVYLALSANTLSGGSILSFSLRCQVNELTSLATVTVTINAPPRPGVFSVIPSPSQLMSYVFAASQWVDTDLPLQYQFGYTSPLKVNVLLISKSEFSHGSSPVPSGLASNGYNVKCFADILDSLNANASAETNVVVQQTMALSYLPSLSALTKANSIKQTTSLVSSILNAVDCTSAPVCSALNRNGCYKTANTCGSCKSPLYFGDEGDSNSKCSLFRQRTSRKLTASTTSWSCTVSEDCDMFEVCVGGSCIAPRKTCASNCSSHGDCLFVNSHSGYEISDCRVGDTHCEAICDCTTEYLGSSDCSKTVAEVSERRESRLLLIQTLARLMDSEDPDTQSVEAWIISMNEATLKPDEMSVEAIALILSVSQAYIAKAQQVGLNPEIAIRILKAVDGATKANKNLFQRRRLSNVAVDQTALQSMRQTTESIRQFNAFVSSTLLPGQDSLDVVLSQFRTNTQVVSVIASRNFTLVSPSSSLETLQDTPQSNVKLSLGESNLTSLQMSTSVMKASVYKHLVDSLQSDSMSVHLSDLPCDSDTDVCWIEISLPFIQSISSSLLQSNTSEYANHTCSVGDYSVHNYTCTDGTQLQLQCNGTAEIIVQRCPYITYTPVCNALNEESLQIEDGGCRTVSYTDVSIVCSCPLTSFRRRMLDSSNSSSDGYSASYVSMLSTVKTSFVSTVTSAQGLNASSASRGWKVLVTIGVFASCILLALFLSNRYDTRQRMTKGNKDYLLKEKSTKSNKMFTRKSRRPPRVRNPTQQHNLQKQRDLKLIEECLPKVLSESISLSSKIADELKRHHRWLAVVFFYSEQFPRVLRVISLATNIIIMLFIQSVTYTLTNPDDGSCDLLTNERDCLVPRSPYATGESKCTWTVSTDLTTEGACTYIDPGSSMKIILFVAIFSAILSTPIALLSDLIIQNVLSATTQTKSVKMSGQSQRVDSMTGLVPTSETKRRSTLWNRLTKSKDNQLVHLMHAQTELRSLSSELHSYRDNLSSTQREEFDLLWGLDSRGEFFSSEPDAVVTQTTLLQRMGLAKKNADVKQIILDELCSVQESVAIETENMNDNVTDRLKGKRLLFLFQCDLLPGISGQILQSKGQRDMITTKRVSFASKLSGWIFIFLLNAGMLFYILLFALSQNDKQQGAWFQSFILWLAAEILLVSTSMVLLTHVIIPLLTMKDVTKIKQRLMDNIRDFHEGIDKKRYGAVDAAGEVKMMFNAAKYLFVSTRLAKLYPDLKESQIIAQFSTPWPKQSYQHVTEVSKNYSKKFTAFTRAVSIIAIFFLTNLLQIPPHLQDMVVKVATTATIGYTILLHLQLFGIFPLLAFGPFLLLCIVVHFMIQSGRANAKSKLAKLLPSNSDLKTLGKADEQKNSSGSLHLQAPTESAEQLQILPIPAKHTTRRQSVAHGIAIAEKLLVVHNGMEEEKSSDSSCSAHLLYPGSRSTRMQKTSLDSIRSLQSHKSSADSVWLPRSHNSSVDSEDALSFNFDILDIETLSHDEDTVQSSTLGDRYKKYVWSDILGASGYSSDDNDSDAISLFSIESETKCALDDADEKMHTQLNKKLPQGIQDIGMSLDEDEEDEELSKFEINSDDSSLSTSTIKEEKKEKGNVHTGRQAYLRTDSNSYQDEISSNSTDERMGEDNGSSSGGGSSRSIQLSDVESDYPSIASD